MARYLNRSYWESRTEHKRDGYTYTLNPENVCINHLLKMFFVNFNFELSSM